jgi:hypothetical protein
VAESGGLPTQVGLVTPVLGPECDLPSRRDSHLTYLPAWGKPRIDR